MTTAIWWIRRDLRQHDNQTLTTALTHHHVIPTFILDPVLLATSHKRVAFLLDGLRQLNDDLRAHGSYLIVRQGDPVTVLTQLQAQTDAVAIYAEADYSPYARRRDARVAAHLPLYLCPGLTIQPVTATMKKNGQPYTVFTPFSKSWLNLPPANIVQPAPTQIHTPSGLTSQPIPDQPQLPTTVPFIAGETTARDILNTFTIDGAIYDYADQRDRMDLDGTARLSPYLRFGMISATTCIAAARDALDRAPDENGRISVRTWINELVWREFYIYILYHFPHVHQGNFRAKYDHIPWRNHPDEFTAWCQGQTGYPIVDAAMRQLSHTGWMHNRARMIVASFLVKDLLVDWRWGQKWFGEHLLDGDPAANNGGWQWSAGTGTDAAPYFRIFNPTTQGKKFDPDGRYIRTWLPELALVPPKYIHTPAQMPIDLQTKISCHIGTDYPPPLVDHKLARQRTLAVYKQV